VKEHGFHTILAYKVWFQAVRVPQLELEDEVEFGRSLRKRARVK
jgi:hypothetical protein